MRGERAEPGKVTVLDLERARTGRFEVVFVLGLEEGSLPRRGGGSPFLDDEAREKLGGRLQRADQVSRDRYLFYTACSRADAPPVPRARVGDRRGQPEGSRARSGTRCARSSPREEVERCDDATAALRADVAARGRPDRARTSARARLDLARPRSRGRRDRRARTAGSGGSTARGARSNAADAAAPPARARDARRAHDLPRHRARAVRRLLVRVVRRAAARPEDDRRRGRPEAPRLGRAQRAAPVLRRAAEGARHRPRRARAGRRRRPLHAAVPRRGARGRAHGDDRRCSAASSTQSLWRDLEALVRAEADAELAARAAALRGLVRHRSARRRSCSAGSTSARVTLSREDRPHRRRPVQRARDRHDYKSGKARTRRAEIEKELRLQIPLYMLVLRDLVGIEPLGGVYRPLAGDAEAARPAARRREDEALPALVERLRRRRRVLAPGRGGARNARGLGARIRAGDVRHDPQRRRVPARGATSGRCAGSAGREPLAPNPEQQAAIEAAGRRVRLRRRGHRQDGRARRAVRPRGLRPRARRRARSS